MPEPRFTPAGGMSKAAQPPRFAGPENASEAQKRFEDLVIEEGATARFQRITKNHRVNMTLQNKLINSLPLTRPDDDTQRFLEEELVSAQEVPPKFHTPKAKRSLLGVAGTELKEAFFDEPKRHVKNLTIGALGVGENMLAFSEMVGFDKGVAKDQIKSTKQKFQEWQTALQPEDPDFIDVLGQGAGSALTFFVPGAGIAKGSQLLAKVSPSAARWFGASASAFLEASAESGGVYEQGLQMGMTEKEAKMAATRTFGINAVLVSLTNRMGIFGEQRQMVRKALNDMTTEGLQEFLQQVTSNVNLGEEWDKGAYQAAGIGAILGPLMGAVNPTSEADTRNVQQRIEEKLTPEELQSNLVQTMETLNAEGIISDKRMSQFKERGLVNLKEDAQSREGIEIPTSPEPRLPGEPKAEIETQPRFEQSRTPEAESRLPGRKGDEQVQPGEDAGDNLDDVPLSELSPQGVQDAADTQKLVDQGMDPQGAVRQVSQNQNKVDLEFKGPKDTTAVSKTSEQGRITTQRPEIKSTSADKRNLQQETRQRIQKQNEQISDEAIRKQRAELLLEEETVDDIIIRKRGIRTNAEVERAARALKVSEEALMNMQPGEAANAEQQAAVAQTVQFRREVQKELVEFQQRFEEGGTEANLSKSERNAVMRAVDNEQTGQNMDDRELVNLALFDHTRKLRKLEMTQFALKSETGRALQIAKKQMDAVDLRLRSIYNRLKNRSSLEQEAIVEELAQIDIEDPKAYVEFLNKIEQPDAFDKFAEWTVAVKLWNPTTQAVNLGSNALRQGVDVFVTATEAAVTGDPQLLAMDAAGAMTGLQRGTENAIRVFTDTGYAQSLSKYLETGGQAPAIKGLTGKVIRIPFRLLTAGDEFFKGIAYDRALYREAWKASAEMTPMVDQKNGKSRLERRKEVAERLMTARGLTDKEFVLYERIHKKASDEAKKMTFQEDMDEVTKWVNQGRTPARFKSTFGKSVATIGKSFFPFLKTPTNILKQGLRDFGGLGLYGHLTDPNASHSDKVRRTSEAAIGLGLMGWAASLAMRGLITGAPPKDDKEKTKFYDVEKKLPYAIKIGDNWVQYKRLEPFAINLGLVADWWNLPDDNPSKLQMASHLWYIFARQMEDKSYLSGLGNIVDLISPEDWRRERAFNDLILSNIFPSIIPHTARSLDPTLKEAKNTNLIEGIRSRVPGQSQKVTPMVDVYGNDVTRANKGLMYFFNPVQVQSAVIDDPVSQELIALDHMVSLPGTRVYLEGEVVQLDRDQYEMYSRIIGLTWHSVMQTIVETPGYKSADREQKIELMDSTKRKITSIASKIMAARVVAGKVVDAVKLGEEITDESVRKILQLEPLQ